MRILFSAWPARGHVYPMLPLVRAAQAAGHDVMFATARDLADELERAGIETMSAGPTWSEALTAYIALGPEPHGLTPDQRIRRDVDGLFTRSNVLRAAELVPQARDWRPDMVIHEPVDFAAAVVAAVTGAEHLVHGLSLAPEQFLEPVRDAVDEVARPWNVPGLADGYRDRPYLDIVPPALEPDGNGMFAQATSLRPSVGEVRPGEALPPEMAKLLDGELVYLTMGTLFNGKPEVFLASLAGLLELGVNVLVTVGPDSDPDVLGPQPSNVVVLPFVSQALVLPHCSLVVHHGGSGTTLGSFVHGLPQLIMPQGADQFLNAAAASDAGAAIGLMPEDVTAESVASAASRLLYERDLRAAARHVQAEIAAMPSADSVLADLVP